jgi:hypothetical protein
MLRTWTLLMGVAAAVVVAMGVSAQTPPGPMQAGGGGFFPGGFPGMGQGSGLADVQTLIRASTEEWRVIGPKLSALIAARAAAQASIDASALGSGSSLDQAGRGRMGGGPFGAGWPPGNDSFEGPGTVGARGFGPGRFGPGRADPNGAGQGQQGFGPGGFGRGAFGFMGPGGPDPNGAGPGGPRPDGFMPGPQGFGGGWRGFGGFGRGGPGPGFGPGLFGGGGGAVMQALMDLRTVALDPNATTEQIKVKAAAVRAAREKAKADAAAAQKDLLQLLTPDQEAILVALGTID